MEHGSVYGNLSLMGYSELRLFDWIIRFAKGVFSYFDIKSIFFHINIAVDIVIRPLVTSLSEFLPIKN